MNDDMIFFMTVMIMVKLCRLKEEFSVQVRGQRQLEIREIYLLGGEGM